ncbi:hypothetical protein EDB84DRAFT_1557596 [Lactarius hengduanensis]|nr:hypothetical protein EDB84DRAFT_1557596 [Lactarius hengduanensis]
MLFSCLEKERELESNATELFGSSTLGLLCRCGSRQHPEIVAQFQRGFRRALGSHYVKRHQDKPLYSTFVEHHVRALAMPLRDVDFRKAASGLTTLANEKQREKWGEAKSCRKARPWRKQSWE